MRHLRLDAVVGVALWIVLLGKIDSRAAARQLDLSEAVVVVSPGEREQAETMAATILVEEVAKRTHINLTVRESWPTSGRAVIAVTTRGSQTPWSHRVPRHTVRLTGNGASPLRGDGVRLPVTKRAKGVGEFQEFAVPAALTADGALRLTWDPVDESHLNWTALSCCRGLAIEGVRAAMKPAFKR